MITITLPDGSERQYDEGVRPIDVALSISEGLARNVLAAKVNGVVVDANRPIASDSDLQLLTWNDEDGKRVFWHSTAHLLAEALEALYPGVKFGIGPPIDAGFYYDIDTGDTQLSSDDFDKIEEKMKALAKEKNTYTRQEVSKADALDFFSKKGDEYKVELIQDLADGEITFYHQGGFTDLCRGPHLPNTGFIKALKLTALAGAYWRGDENNKQLTRIYGISFPKAKELTEYLALVEEAKKRDHRKLGAELDLFMFSELVGPGLPIWLPKGTTLRHKLQDYLRDRQTGIGYQEVLTPHIARKELYETSGHYAKYGADSFQPIKTPREGEMYMLKPMNCPHHCQVFANKPRSYRDLPMRISEFGTVYRYEQSGELHGLARVRGFTQDDAHIFCTKEQIKGEFLAVLALTKSILEHVGFYEFTAQISLRDPENPDKYIGSDENWEAAEKAIIEATEEVGLETTVELGEAAFYGPKLDFMIKDALKRSWQLGTIQVDYTLPERFELEYTGSDNQMHRPVMIHRAPFGSMERFISILIEHTGGKFPLWLAPVQFSILTISERFDAYAEEVKKQLEKAGLQGTIDSRSEKIGKKIRDAELEQTPFMLIVGEKEQENKSLGVRQKEKGDLGDMPIDQFIAYFNSCLDEI